jgi:hypothetical protein
MPVPILTQTEPVLTQADARPDLRGAGKRTRRSGSPDIAHQLERDPEIDDRHDPAPERPATRPPLTPAVLLGVDPGPAEPDDEEDSEPEHGNVGDLVQVSEAVPAQHSERKRPGAKQVQAEQQQDHGGDGGQRHGQQMTEKLDRQMRRRNGQLCYRGFSVAARTVQLISRIASPAVPARHCSAISS